MHATARRTVRWTVGLLAAAGIVVGWTLLGAQEASANGFGMRDLRRGSKGDDVKELQIRVAGWYLNCSGSAKCHDHFHLDGIFGPKTERALRNWEKSYDRPVDGVAGAADYQRFWSLEEPDRSTAHFEWSEFHEKSQECNTPNRGSFRGGGDTEARVAENVRQLMWRLEAMRYKLDDQHPIYVTSGFRSRAYQDCLRERHGRGVARDSQHSYGSAADTQMSGVNFGRARGLAKTSEVHAIFCYANSRHNHFDIRLDNVVYTGARQFMWPATNGSGKDLDHDGRVCHGGHTSAPSTGTKSPAVGLPLPDPWGVAEDPAGPSEAEGAALAAASEEAWLNEDQDNLAELFNALCACVPEIHSPTG